MHQETIQLLTITGPKSVRTRLALTMAATVCGCVLLTVLTFLAVDFRQGVVAEKMRLENTAAVFAATVSGPVAALQPNDVRAALRSIRDIQHVRHVSVKALNGELIAEMGGGASLDGQRASIDKLTAWNAFFTDDMTVIVPVRGGGQVIAALTLQSDISWIRREFASRMTTALLLASLGIALTFSVAYRRIFSITGPLTDLAKSFVDIGSRTDLAQRITARQEGEVGVLISAFNNMFERIAERDAKLQRHRDTLEQTVEARTSELVTARDDAERANAAKSEFLAMVGHEIRTPMNGMMVMAEMLAAAPLGPRHLRYAEIINRSGRNLLAIINDILDLSKIEAGKLDIEAAPFSIDSVVEDIAGLFSERAREKGLALAFVINPEVPDKLKGDAARLTQIVTNLVNNALKFTETGGVLIHVSSGLADDGSRASISIRVQDTGIGIARDKLDHVFERFAQADQSITRRFGGTGLGLAISKRLVEAMDGRISVDSEEDKGAAFTVDLMLPVVEHAQEMPSLSGKQIAIAHSNSIHRDALRQMLQGLGASVLEMPASFESLTVDAILSDSVAGSVWQEAADTPVLRLVPRARPIEGGLANEGRTLEFVYPPSRQDVFEFASAVRTGDFQLFDAKKIFSPSRASLPEFRGLKALVVDDNPVNCEVLQEALFNMGASVALAQDGADALFKMHDEEYGIVFMDCSMPVMDGFEATRKWRANETGKRLPIVALTAYADGASGDEWNLAGMDLYLTKPFTMPSIAEAIIKLVPGSFSGAAGIVAPQSSSNAANGDSLLPGVPLLDAQTISMISKLSARSGQNAARRIFGLFVQHAPSSLERLERAILENRADEVAELAHALKSMASSAGAHRLFRLADEIEMRSAAGEAIGSGPMADLADALKKSIEAFDELVSKEDPAVLKDKDNKAVA
jgi:signal transduction histidine kinase/CheY-like chemotaxis protein